MLWIHPWTEISEFEIFTFSRAFFTRSLRSFSSRRAIFVSSLSLLPWITLRISCRPLLWSVLPSGGWEARYKNDEKTKQNLPPLLQFQFSMISALPPWRPVRGTRSSRPAQEMLSNLHYIGRSRSFFFPENTFTSGTNKDSTSSSFSLFSSSFSSFCLLFFLEEPKTKSINKKLQHFVSSCWLSAGWRFLHLLFTTFSSSLFTLSSSSFWLFEHLNSSTCASSSFVRLLSLFNFSSWNSKVIN